MTLSSGATRPDLIDNQHWFVGVAPQEAAYHEQYRKKGNKEHECQQPLWKRTEERYCAFHTLMR
jgi:hypothetical protein